MEAPLRHINGRICPPELADKLTNIFDYIHDTTCFSVFFQTIMVSNPAIVFCSYNCAKRTKFFLAFIYRSFKQL